MLSMKILVDRHTIIDKDRQKKIVEFNGHKYFTFSPPPDLFSTRPDLSDECTGIVNLKREMILFYPS